MDTQFTAESFFDLAAFPFAEIFQGKKYVWESLSATGDFIRMLFEKDIVKANYKDTKDVHVGDGTIIQEGALILGPCVIGKNSRISHGALLRQNCIVGENVHIGHGAEIKNSIILNNATVAHLNYVGDSILGNFVNIAGGAMLANYRFDQKTIRVKTEETVIETNLLKLGAIVGDNSQIGVNAVLNPGTVLGKGTIVYPLVSVAGVHANSAVVR